MQQWSAERDSLAQADLYLPSLIPYNSSATNRLITAKDHASIQLNVADVNEEGRSTNSFSTYALCGFVRKEAEADDSINRLATHDGYLKNVWSYQQ
jgi:small subunit ribosomal protein S21e